MESETAASEVQMKETIEKMKKKISICKMGDRTDWRDGYMAGLTDAIQMIEDGIAELIVPNNNYFVIMYHNGDKYYPYVEEMRLYRKTEGRGGYVYSFTRNIYPTEVNKPDLVLSSLKAVKKRVFFTREQAEESLKD